MKLVECVPNFSEGRRPEIVAAIRDAIAAVDGATLLDVSSDPSHNRSVITFVAPASRAADAALAGAEPLEHNGYKVPLAKALVRRALTTLTQGT